MVAYHYDFRIALVKGSPNTVAANATVLVYDPADTGYTAPVTVYSDPAMTMIANLVTDAYGVVPDFWTNNLPDLLWKSGAMSGGWATTSSRPGLRGATGPQGAQGIQGPQGNPGLNGAGTNSDVAAYVPAAGPTRDALDARYPTKDAQTAALNNMVAKGSLVLNVKDYGAKGDGTTDDTAAIQSAINAAAAGAVIYFPPTGSGSWYKITNTLTVTTPNLTFRGNPRDAYTVSIRCAVASKVMISVKAASFVFQYLGLIGDSSATNGAGATVTGIEIFGDTDGNMDANIWNGTFQWLAVGIRTHGRNATISNDTLFSNSLKAIVVDGKDATYHTGSGADQNRGNTIRQCRFHNIGAAATDSAIELTATAKVLHMLIDGNYFDSNGFGVHIRATGTSANPHKGISAWNNKHTECQAEAYALTYVNYSTISDVDILGYTATGAAYGNGFTLNNCDTLSVRNVLGVQIGKVGVYARNCPNLDLNNVNFSSVGQDGTSSSHGFDIDSTNNNPAMTRIKVGNAPGWGFTGSPFNPAMYDSNFLTCTLGRINSTTVTNRTALGRNTFIEGGMGRMEDEGRQVYDFTAATAKTVATITGGGNYSSFLFSVEFSAANGSVDNYAFARYSVRTENGTPVVTALGTSSLARVAITTAASGTQGITVALNCTGAASGTVIVRASAGGAANTTNPRGVTVAMA